MLMITSCCQECIFFVFLHFYFLLFLIIMGKFARLMTDRFFREYRRRPSGQQVINLPWLLLLVPAVNLLWLLLMPLLLLVHERPA